MSDKYRKDLSIEVLVGFFMFIILIALGVFTIVLSRQNFLQKRYPVVVHFDEISGLRTGDNVFLRGMKVGVVKETALDSGNVIVRADLEVPVQFREGYQVEVVASSMLGGKQMKIDEGPLSAAPLAEGSLLTGTKPTDILEELGAAVAGIRTMTDQVSAGQGTLGKLIQDDTLYNNLRNISDKLAKGEGTLGKLIHDDALYNNLREVSDKLAKGEGTLGKFIQDDTLYNNLREVSDKLAKGQGTLGKLVNDDQLYTEVQKLLGELRAALDDMRETSPVTTFGQIFFGAF